MFYVDIRNSDFYTFYYNMEAEVNKAIWKAVDNNILQNRPISAEAQANINRRGYLLKEGSAHLGVMGSYNPHNKEVEFLSAVDMAGITATVNRAMAEEILQRAVYYCPKNTGDLAASGRIEDLGNGKCRVVFDCRYAWYVHEYTWKQHKYPECAKFLSRAVFEVEKLHGFNWNIGNGF